MAADLDRDLPLLGILPAPEEKANYRFFRGESPLGPDFTYSLILPHSWTYHPPDGVIDLDEGPAPLGVFSAHPRMVPPTLISVGVLRANTAVSLMTFYAGYCHITDQTPLLMRPIELPAYLGVDGLIDTPDGLRMRLIMTEDGGRVLVIAGVATLDDYAREARQLATIMVSVGFEALRGPTMGVGNE
ncbi:MAG: hypothetical protein JNL82_35260 [Myxococcales bacterium]|nr:hypothetical protein [Myxococcales bacterium]